MKADSFLFDSGDRELVNAIAGFDGTDSDWNIRQYASELHPRGILELIEPRELRIVKTVMALLDTFSPGASAMNKRINALTLLRDELCEGLNVTLRYNTARVLLELAKELIRVRHDTGRALRTAHDLRMALLGNPLFIRSQLRRFQLVEMPEECLPVSFDYHVHDANTKGRKSPSHLIMDAWIKGIRKLQVVYYNTVPPDAAFELLRGAEIMGVDLRIGVEFRTLYRGRYVDLIWTPRGFSGANGFIKFLSRHKNASFRAKCEEAARGRVALVYEMLHEFNRSGRKKFNAAYQCDLPEITDAQFSAFLPARRQPSPEHIGEYLEQWLRPKLEEELQNLDRRKELKKKKQSRREELIVQLDELSSGKLRNDFLDNRNWETPPENPDSLPELVRMSPRELLGELRKISTGFRITLNLTKLDVASTVEILYDCRGEITTLEIFNLKDYASGTPRCDRELNELRKALNSGNVVKLKALILNAIEELKKSDHPDKSDHIDKLKVVLRNLPKFTGFYIRTPLRAAIGSDSAGKATPALAGMGMGVAVLDTLDNRVRRKFRNSRAAALLPIRAEVFRQVSFRNTGNLFFRGRAQCEWLCSDRAVELGGKGNMIALGNRHVASEFTPKHGIFSQIGIYWHYLNSNIKIALKILIGFLITFLTFYLSGSWWVLAWFGAPIWLGITLLRNILQFRIAGGTFRSSPLLKWNEFISWQRVADSLFFTGLSVPLLDYVVKTLLMKQLCGITVENDPMLVYAGIGLANGLYLTTHNLLRALPMRAVWGNWLRVPLAIPLAFGINFLIEVILGMFGISGVELILQQWAAVISKLASDSVGGIIEAWADRAVYLEARRGDVKRKLKDFYHLVAALELVEPEKALPKRIEKKEFVEIAGGGNGSLLTGFYLNALDMMYFWMRQPRAPEVISKILRAAEPEEKRIFFAVQKLLIHEKSVGKLLLDGAVGENFARVFAFYVRAYPLYLAELARVFPKT